MEAPSHGKALQSQGKITIQDLVAMLTERMGFSIQEAMRVVYHSNFHAKLLDIETGLYLEGSEYLYQLLCEELEEKGEI
jgi:hypothetical protein